jgi:hypothetical protein
LIGSAIDLSTPDAVVFTATVYGPGAASGAGATLTKKVVDGLSFQTPWTPPIFQQSGFAHPQFGDTDIRGPDAESDRKRT